ncbi:hydroxyacid dehydrogenase [Microbacterium sp. W1N]|uniref:hydroxyacid dehydrogenase n=1 Tax=Microbacterium festucae TaxID=2977531 RepID=UPI0021C06F93|nr:hydroxyacid dehydrogenase [Microbacterium festucae]MCT9819339.1 hydroxyacid dehydrogenase [Microbacterium festucae]
MPATEAAAMFPAATRAALEGLGAVAVAEPRDLADPDAFRAAMRGVDVVVTAWGFPRLDAARLADAPDLRFVMHAASSLKALTDDAFWASGLPISQAGAAMAPAVAELSLTFTMALLRRVQRTDHALRSGGDWEQARQVPRAREIAGCRIGVVGASRTGREYIRMCQALGAEVLVFDPYLPDDDPLRACRRGLDELLAEAEVLALHAPITAETTGMLGARELAQLRDGALVVNTARAELLDADALYAAVASGRLDAALDVFEEEPLTERWRTLPNVLVTPHLGGATVESRHRAGQIVVSEIRRFAAGEPLQYALTRADLERMG